MNKITIESVTKSEILFSKKFMEFHSFICYNLNFIDISANNRKIFNTFSKNQLKISNFDREYWVRDEASITLTDKICDK